MLKFDDYFKLTEFSQWHLLHLLHFKIIEEKQNFFLIIVFILLILSFKASTQFAKVIDLHFTWVFAYCIPLKQNSHFFKYVSPKHTI